MTARIRRGDLYWIAAVDAAYAHPHVVVPKSQLGECIGALSAARVEQILDGLRFQQRSFTRDR